MMKMSARRTLLSLLTLPAAILVAADDRSETPEPLAPQVAAASAEGERAIQGFQLAPGLKAELFAAEPLVANPVAFCLDPSGRVYVCESFRQNAGVTDNRGHDQEWLNADLAAQTVADRLAYHRRLLGEKLAEYTLQDDRIRLLTDRDGDGRADDSSVFAHRFNQVVEGTGAGVLAHRGDVYYTCIPHLWRLRDHDGDGQADVRQSLHYGFGVRVAFRGHDLHGLILGPDRRLYFSIGDRGYHIVTPEGRLADPESGAVFRCRLDGSELEVFATGLRNPQELAFDDFGNLFTGDNNSDSGDKARWVFVVPGSDSGWRMSYQYLPDRGPFNREQLWHPYHSGQPAYIVPPIANFADGPAGLVYDPGVGLPAPFRGRFFLCDFRGGPANSGVRSFRVRPQGAFFQLVDAEQPIWKILATDIDFGPDGSLYVSDWVNGWNGEGKGRIYRIVAPETQNDPLVRATQELLRSGFADQSLESLQTFLGHADRRVRMGAQFELVDRRAERSLEAAVAPEQPLLARVHAVWGLAQLQPLPIMKLTPLLNDREAEVRAQAAAMLGENRVAAAIDPLIRLLRDPEPRVRYHAAIALGRIGAPAAIGALTEMLAANADQDPIVRHGAIMGLVGARADPLVPLVKHPSRSVRLAAVVALRKLRHPQIADFLADGDPAVVTEAARAIYDLPLEAALPQLAAQSVSQFGDPALVSRVLHANYRLGDAKHAERLATAAANAAVDESMRREALTLLRNWQEPSPRDRLLGMWRPLPAREQRLAVEAVRETLPDILAGPAAIRREGAKLAAHLGMTEAVPVLRELFQDAELPGEERGELFLALAAVSEPEATALLSSALSDRAAEVRGSARQVLLRMDPQRAIHELERAATAPERIERQAAIAQIASMPHPEAAQALSRLVERLLAGQIPDDTQLDVLEAAARRPEPTFQQQLAQYEQQRTGQDPADKFRETLHGGNAARGRTIFFERAEASCVRCHKIGDRGGEVGPDLTKIGGEKTRQYLLESLVDPNRAIAKGYESTTIVDADGRIHVGVVKLDDEQRVQIITADAKTVTIEKQDIEDRQPAKSPMPEDLVQKLSKFDLRDLVEFLSQTR